MIRTLIRTFILFVFICISPIISWAFSASLIGVQDHSQISSSNLTIGTQNQTGEGLLISTHLHNRFSISTGAVYFNRAWTDETTNSALIYTSKSLMIPLIVDYHFFFINFGLGGYYSQNQGTLNQFDSTNNSSLTYDSYGIKTSDHGYLGRVNLQLPLGEGISLQLGAIYTQGNANLSVNNSNSFQNRDVFYTAGLTFIPHGGHGGEHEPHK